MKTLLALEVVTKLAETSVPFVAKGWKKQSNKGPLIPIWFSIVLFFLVKDLFAVSSVSWGQT